MLAMVMGWGGSPLDIRGGCHLWGTFYSSRKQRLSHHRRSLYKEAFLTQIRFQLKAFCNLVGGVEPAPKESEEKIGDPLKRSPPPWRGEDRIGTDHRKPFKPRTVGVNSWFPIRALLVSESGASVFLGCLSPALLWFLSRVGL